MTTTLRDRVSPIYHSLLPQLFDQPAPLEKRATCQQCAMCPPESDQIERSSEGFFNPTTKCCTFYPDVPCYSIGALLQDERPAWAEGKRRVREIIASGHGVTPTGIHMPPVYRRHYAHAATLFGHSEQMRCPHYADGACSIWEYRESVCATYFCKHDRGADGMQFYKTLRTYLDQLRISLVTHILLELGLSAELVLKPSPDTVTPEELDGKRAADSFRKSWWGPWLGREEELFRKCYDLLKRLDPQDVPGLGGSPLRGALARAQDAYAQMCEPLIPLRLKKNAQIQVEPGSTGKLIVSAYSRADPTSMSPKVLALLDDFDGTRTTEQINAERKQRLLPTASEGLIRSLYHHRVLLPVDAGE